MAMNLPMLVLVLTVAFIGFISIDEAEARALLPGSVERGSSLIKEYSQPATLLVPSPSSPYGPAPFKSSSITEDDAATTTITMISKTDMNQDDDIIVEADNNKDDSLAKSPPPPPPPPPYSPYGPSPCRGSIQYNIPANCVTTPVSILVDTI